MSKVIRIGLDTSKSVFQLHGIDEDEITRAGDERLRSVLVAGATAVIAYWRRTGRRDWPWLAALIDRKPAKLAAVALANKMARVARKMMVNGERYQPPGRTFLGTV